MHLIFCIDTTTGVRVTHSTLVAVSDLNVPRKLFGTIERFIQMSEAI